MAEISPSPLPPEPPVVGDERATLMAFLDYFRGVFLRKLEGLDDTQARTAACPPSILTPLGLARHMADVERGWFRRSLGEDIDFLLDYSVDYDNDFHPDAEASLPDAIETWGREVDAARANLERFQLDDLLVAGRDPRKSVRWTVVHMIEEYARHCGHLDLICEAIDGRTGD